ncbi:glycosyltransferase family 39 protein, partial [Neoroseomonas rubea]|uniref:glycosyltransferase family 39 protein n=1 Tax=Neoroseomonas rubea TaxID=2748666 RepID=UPI0018E04B78
MSDRQGTLSERDKMGLAALLLAAFLLRLPGLAGDAPWIDESASIGLGGLPWGVVFGEMARIEASPPGYYAIAGLLGRLGLEGPVPLRLLSAAAAALSVLPFFLVCRTAFGLRAAWLAAGIVALQASLIRHGQDGRTYALLFLLFCCALLAALRLVLAARAGRGGIAAGAPLALAQGGML